MIIQTVTLIYGLHSNGFNGSRKFMKQTDGSVPAEARREDEKAGEKKTVYRK